MTDDVGDRIQRRILSETRAELAEAERKLEVVEGQVQRLSSTIIDKQKLMDDRIKEAEAQIALVAEKDATIAALQQRLANLNDEYNGIKGRRNALGMAQADKEAMRNPRQFTTLEDVYKMTGESYSKDDHRS